MSKITVVDIAVNRVHRESEDRRGDREAGEGSVETREDWRTEGDV